MLSAEKAEFLSSVFYGEGGGAFAPNAATLLRYVRNEIRKNDSPLRFTLREVEDYLGEQQGFGEVNQVVRGPLKRFARRLIVSGSGVLSLQADTMYLRGVPRSLNVNYLFVFVNMLSRRTFLAPATTLNSASAAKALDGALTFFATNGGMEGVGSIVLETDRGPEWAGEFGRACERLGVKHVRLLTKAYMVERRIRSVRSVLVRILTMDRRMNIREAIRRTQSILNASHSSVLDGLAPNEVRPENAERVLMAGMRREWAEDARRGPPTDSDIFIGDTVRVRVPPAGGVFFKEGRKTFSEETYKVAALDYMRGGVPVFRLQNRLGQDVDARFARPDLKIIKRAAKTVVPPVSKE